MSPGQEGQQILRFFKLFCLTFWRICNFFWRCSARVMSTPHLCVSTSPSPSRLFLVSSSVHHFPVLRSSPSRSDPPLTRFQPDGKVEALPSAVARTAFPALEYTPLWVSSSSFLERGKTMQTVVSCDGISKRRLMVKCKIKNKSKESASKPGIEPPFFPRPEQ
ncbi:hypothetical protein BT67DRAFT_287954 [Trichocladium antarcticum]|uniref:Uncharacterized protein n=1 Tax=Trichocladium antarcticum TaxID=1450529 RepID=A0AAN6ULN7_9PEZI|nr:hypothetical protein BT67DRAFT_287954 [Trichocladium antarcticum]